MSREIENIERLIDNKKAQFRDFQIMNIEVREAAEGEPEKLIIRGVPCVFNQETLLFRWDNYMVFEQVDERAFDEADMSDVIFNYNHGGRVFARTRNNSLKLTVNKKQKRMEMETELWDDDEGHRQLYRDIKRGNIDKILNVFCQHGASTAILADAHPHIGTDRLPKVIENMRNTIIRCGGEVHFQTKMTRLICREANCVIGVEAEVTSQPAPHNSHQEFMGPVILATGHSARDVYRYLAEARIEIEAKGIAVGVRLEHPSMLIDQIQYHSRQGRGKYLPAAEYSFVTQVDGRGVYSFCMCPGGFVIPAATDKEQIVVNGMSPANRGTAWSNSGMVVEIRPEDVESMMTAFPNPDIAKDSPLAMMAFQEELERLCWQQGNRKQTAPAQRMADFVNNRLSYDLPKSSYAPGIISSPLHFWLPPMVSHRLQEGFKTFGRQAHGFLTNEAVLIAVETRTSSPVRIVRNSETLQHVSISGLFPCGEGAGYAGGIVSAGVDGERCAEMCAEYLKS